MTKTIERDHAAGLYRDGSPKPGATAGPWMYIATQHVRTARWEEVYWLVVREQNTYDLYGVEFREGLTESQETILPWEDDGPPLKLVRLDVHTVTKTEYRKVAA